MRTLKQVTIPARTDQVMDETSCDLCGRVTKRGDAFDGASWSESSYDIARTKVQMETGSSYPEGGDKTTIAFDVCTTCFTEKLIPWMASQGATPRNEESDW